MDYPAIIRRVERKGVPQYMISLYWSIWAVKKIPNYNDVCLSYGFDGIQFRELKHD